MNLDSLVAAMNEKDACISRRQKCVKLLASERDLVAKINSGGFHFKLMLKSQEQKTNF